MHFQMMKDYHGFFHLKIYDTGERKTTSALNRKLEALDVIAVALVVDIVVENT